MAKYSVLLPTYNESENLPIVVPLLFEVAETHGFDLEVVVVDDNSPDGTAKIAQQLKEVYPGKITLHSRPGKLGLGSAYIDGLRYCSGDFVFLMDADLSHHPKYLPEYIQKQQQTGADIVTGTRYRPGGGVGGWNLFRKLTSRVANFIANTLMDPKCSDLTGSFRLYKKDVLSFIMPRIQSRGYVFQMEAIVRAREECFHIEEVPIVFIDRLFGESKLGGNEILAYLKGLFALAGSARF